MWVRRGTGTPTDGTGTLATAGSGSTAGSWTAAGATAGAVGGPGAWSSVAIGASAAAIDTVVVMAGNCGAGGMAHAR